MNVFVSDWTMITCERKSLPLPRVSSYVLGLLKEQQAPWENVAQGNHAQWSAIKCTCGPLGLDFNPGAVNIKQKVNPLGQEIPAEPPGPGDLCKVPCITGSTLVLSRGWIEASMGLSWVAYESRLEHPWGYLVWSMGGDWWSTDGVTMCTGGQPPQYKSVFAWNQLACTLRL